jgi:S1-C subfamily serine protease
MTVGVVGMGVQAQPHKAARDSAMSMLDPVGSFAPMLSRVIPAVVTILVVGETYAPVDVPPRKDSDVDVPWPAPQKERFRSGGSGVIVNPAEGLILTNNHVIDNAVTIEVVLSDGRRMSGKLVGRDIGSDVAVVKVEEKRLPSIEIGDSDNIRVGDVVAAVGNPFGLESTATLGIVSALMRSEVGHGAFEDFMQIDALVNPGNSGGALVDVRGNLVGINTAVAGGEGRNTGIGFAIPINMARAIADELIAHGRMRRGSTGLIVEDLTMESMAAVRTPVNRGALIARVVPNSAAAKAGIRPGGVVVRADNKPVRGAAEFNTRVATLSVGRTMSVVINKAGQETSYPLSVTEIIIEPDERVLPRETGGLEGGVVGDILLGNPLFGELRGAQLLRVPAGSPAHRLGLKVGDVVVAVDSATVRSTDELLRHVSRAGMLFRLKIIRDGIPGWVRVSR